MDGCNTSYYSVPYVALATNDGELLRSADYQTLVRGDARHPLRASLDTIGQAGVILGPAERSSGQGLRSLPPPRPVNAYCDIAALSRPAGLSNSPLPIAISHGPAHFRPLLGLRANCTGRMQSAERARSLSVLGARSPGRLAPCAALLTAKRRIPLN